MITKSFPTHAVMTLYTGVCMGDFTVAHELMEWVVGHPVWTHEMPSHFPFMKEIFAEMFPLLPKEAHKDNWMTMLAEAESTYGKELLIPHGQMQRHNSPLDTLKEITNAKMHR